MKKYLVEFIGTFFLILSIMMSVVAGPAGFAPIAIGGMLMVMIFAGGHISGAHFNPAVTLAVWMRGKCETSDVPGYIVAQLVGGALAALVGAFLLGSMGKTWEAGTFSPIPGLIGEFLGTFALCWVVLNTATSKGTAGNSFYGLAIGFTVTACAYSLGGLSGGAFNPAVAVGVVVGGLSNASFIWVPLVACFAGGAVAALVFGFVRDEDDV